MHASSMRPRGSGPSSEAEGCQMPYHSHKMAGANTLNGKFNIEEESKDPSLVSPSTRILCNLRIVI